MKDGNPKVRPAGRIVKMPDDPMCDRLGIFFTTLAHRTRMRIFCALQHESKPVTMIAANARISVANASQHLRRMRDNGAVVSEKQGQSVYYRIADRRFISAARLIQNALAESMQRKARHGERFLLESPLEAGVVMKNPRSARQPRLSSRKGALL
jgi:DNA-binding transcriptional ArsR family regulator